MDSMELRSTVEVIVISAAYFFEPAYRKARDAVKSVLNTITHPIASYMERTENRALRNLDQHELSDYLTQKGSIFDNL